MTTYRERREARVDRLREWSDKRGQRADSERSKASTVLDGIPIGQPILKGHHSQGRHERDLSRAEGAMRRSVEHSDMAKRHTQKADNIEDALERSVFDDDPDAIERLTERVEALEGRRDRIKAYNVSARKAAKSGGVGDLELLGESERAELVSLLKVAAFQVRPGNGFPGYVLSNLSARIRKDRERIERLKGQDDG